MPDLNSLVQLLTNLIPHNWDSVFTLLGLSATVAIVLQTIKHYGKLQDAKKTVVFLLGALSFAITVADAAIQYNGQNPKLVVSTHLGWVIALAVLIHRFAVSPIYYKIVNTINTYNEALAYKAATSPPAPVSASNQPEFSL